MKKLIFTLLSSFILFFSSNAQFCGVSDSTKCTPDTTIHTSGFSPTTDSLMPLINGVDTSITIHFKNYDSVPVIGKVYSLLIDSITNLPSGICWASNKMTNSFNNQESGCIVISGLTCAAPGQYLLNIYAHINGIPLGNLATKPDGQGALRYYLRVNNAGDNATAVNLSQTTSFVAYGPSAVCSGTGISEPVITTNSLSISPNPISTTGIATYISTKPGQVTERITNIIGSEVYTAQREAKLGTNVYTIQKNNLPQGVYFYSISDSKGTTTKRMIIAE